MRGRGVRPTGGAAGRAAGPDRAVVIGGSIAGLLAACVLADEYDEVVVLDRDDLADEPLPRAAVPHSRHTHSLLTRGRRVVEELLPGIGDELLAAGAITGDVGQIIRAYAGPRHLATGPTGLYGLIVSRGLLEWTIRQRVSRLPRVCVVPSTSVLDLAFDESGEVVTGVVAAGRESHDAHRIIPASLVVDASGRNARTGEWLERRGYRSAPEERIRIDATYATRRFRRPPVQPGGVEFYLHAAVPGLPRAGVAVAQEGDVWSVSVAGYHGERPPTQLGDFVTYLRRLCAPAIADLVCGLEPLDDGAVYRFPANVRRRYEAVEVFPENLLVIGDAVCAFDPTFGQGMTVAALEALELRECLRDGRPHLAARYFPAAAHHIDVPWTLVAQNAPRPAGAPDDRPLAVRLRSRYLAALRRAALDDPVLSAAFLSVTHMVRRPVSLLAPPYLLRVLRAEWTRAARARAESGSGLPSVHGVSRGGLPTWRPAPHTPPVPARHVHNQSHKQTGKLS